MVDAVLAYTEPADIAAIAANLRLHATLAAREAPDRVAIALAPGWPHSLPLPTLAGYGLQPAAAVARAPFEIGAPRAYRRSARPVIAVPVAWQMSGTQQSVFDTLQAITLREGQEWFGLTLAFPSGLALAVARIAEGPVLRALGGLRWQVTATLELLDRPVMSEAALTALLDDAGDPPAWPESLLPRPLLGSWEITPRPATIRTDDGLPGRPQARQRSRDSTAEIPAAWELSADQAALFDGFFRWRGRDGAQWFSFLYVSGSGSRPCDARFTGAADWTPRGSGRWGVAAAIEIRNRPIG